MRKSELIVLGIIFLSVVIGIYLYSQMLDKVASHWNAEGRVNGYMPKFWGLFLMPILSSVLFLFFCFDSKNRPVEDEH